MITPRPHCDLIKDWADGWEIQRRTVDGLGWFNDDCPTWDPQKEYRRKPIELKATIVDGVLTLENGALLDLNSISQKLFNKNLEDDSRRIVLFLRSVQS